MNTTFRQVVLGLSILLGLFVGGWAAFFPRAFYDDFPGATLAWVSVDGPYNEHLIRDVGALYLALAAAGLTAFALRDRNSSRVVGSAWLVFGVPHLYYHLQHLDLLDSTVEAVGLVVSLSVSLAFGIILLMPYRTSAAAAGDKVTR